MLTFLIIKTLKTVARRLLHYSRFARFWCGLADPYGVYSVWLILLFCPLTCFAPKWNRRFGRSLDFIKQKVHVSVDLFIYFVRVILTFYAILRRRLI